MLYYIIGGILLIVLLTAINVKPKPESEWYRTDGIILRVGNITTNRSNPHIEDQTDDGEKILFEYVKNKNIKKSLEGQKVTIYSDIFPRTLNKPHIGALIDENGNKLLGGKYDYDASLRQYKTILSPKPFIICVVLLVLIYLMNGSKKYKNDEN